MLPFNCFPFKVYYKCRKIYITDNIFHSMLEYLILYVHYSAFEYRIRQYGANVPVESNIY